MKNYSYIWLCLLAVVFTLSSCEVIGDIFKAGIWVGIILVFLVVAVIFWIIRKVGR